MTSLISFKQDKMYNKDKFKYSGISNIYIYFIQQTDCCSLNHAQPFQSSFLIWYTDNGE